MIGVLRKSDMHDVDHMTFRESDAFIESVLYGKRHVIVFIGAIGLFLA